MRCLICSIICRYIGRLSDWEMTNICVCTVYTLKRLVKPLFARLHFAWALLVAALACAHITATRKSNVVHSVGASPAEAAESICGARVLLGWVGRRGGWAGQRNSDRAYLAGSLLIQSHAEIYVAPGHVNLLLGMNFDVLPALHHLLGNVHFIFGGFEI